MRQTLFLLLKGMLIGVGAILPGISGGVLCVALKIYAPLMELMAHPIESLKKRLSFYLPVVIGFGLGVLLLSKAVDYLFRTSSTPATWVFVGLILGTMPALLREAKQKGRSKGAYVSLSVSFAAALALFLSLRASGGAAVTPNVFWWALCGVLWGVGIIVPGMSPSAIFIFLGLYQPMSAGIAALDMSILLPMGAGLVLSAALLSRLMRRLLDKHYALTMHAVLGFSIASTLAILPLGQAKGTLDVLLYIACTIFGLSIALWMDSASRKMEIPVE